jgi:tetratricopeptide (TPR) repeat protein
MKKILFFVLSVLLLAPALAQAANAQAEEYDELGMSLYRQGLYAKATTYFQNAVQADPTDWEGYENLGNAYFKINDNADALSAYQKSLQLNPNNSTLENIVQSMQGNTAPASSSVEANPPANNNEPVNSSSNNTQPAVSQPPMGAAPPTSPQSSVDSEQPIDNGQSNQPGYEPSQPGTSTIVVRHRRRFYAAQEPVYNDDLAPIDHAKFWTKLELGYSYASVNDLISGAANINNGTYVNADPGLPTSYSGTALADNSGVHAGAEIGFLLSPNFGIALGVKYIGLDNYNANVAYNDSYGDYEDLTLTPSVLPITLDFYLFMPDSGGRFYLKGGIGYYFGDVHVNESYSYSNFYNQQESNAPENWIGDLYTGAVGFQVGIGREFEITHSFGMEIYAEGRYARLTNFQGTLSDQYGNSFNAGLATGNTNGTIDFATPAYINAANGEHYSTLDFTGFDIGLSFNWYSL